MNAIGRPLGLGELLAETIRLYGARSAAALGVGTVVAGGVLLAAALPWFGAAAVIVAVFTAAYAAAARVARGDGFREAWAQVALRAPALAALALVVVAPVVLVLAAGSIFGLLPAAFWLGLMGFAIPVAALERARPLDALRRSLVLARAEYLHATGVAAALLLSNVLLDIVLAGAVVSFARNSTVAAHALAQLVLAPLFFLGLSALYFEQKARAVSSPRQE